MRKLVLEACANMGPIVLSLPTRCGPVSVCVVSSIAWASHVFFQMITVQPEKFFFLYVSSCRSVCTLQLRMCTNVGPCVARLFVWLCRLCAAAKVETAGNRLLFFLVQKAPLMFDNKTTPGLKPMHTALVPGFALSLPLFPSRPWGSFKNTPGGKRQKDKKR